MSLWLLIIGTLIPQEFATTAVVFVLAVQQHYPLWVIHLIWVGVTLLDMYLGWHLGRVLQDHYQETEFVARIEAWVKTLSKYLGEHGQKLSLALLGIVNFPFVNAFLGAWLGMPMRLTLILTLAGNFVWYLLLWATVLGTTSFVANPDIILLIIVTVGVLSHLSFVLNEQRKKNNARPRKKRVTKK